MYTLLCHNCASHQRGVLGEYRSLRAALDALHVHAYDGGGACCAAYIEADSLDQPVVWGAITPRFRTDGSYTWRGGV